MLTPAETTIIASTTASRDRYGRNSRRIRRPSRSRLGSISSGGRRSGVRLARITPLPAEPCIAPIPLP
jgi:hypothetical protein